MGSTSLSPTTACGPLNAGSYSRYNSTQSWVTRSNGASTCRWRRPNGMHLEPHLKLVPRLTLCSIATAAHEETDEHTCYNRPGQSAQRIASCHRVEFRSKGLDLLGGRRGHIAGGGAGLANRALSSVEGVYALLRVAPAAT
jgi:hypothetical protein